MRILVYPHDLKIGGSQFNAIEIAAALQQRGHELVMFGQPGPLVEHMEKLGLEFVDSGQVRRRPSPTAIKRLRRLMHERQIDVLHGYEWPPSLECYLAARQMSGVAVVSTVMSMAVAPFIPMGVPLTVGTRQLAANELNLGRPSVTLLEPPVDTGSNHPGLNLGQLDFKRRWRLRPDAQVVSIVSRLAHQLKIEGIFAAMEAVRTLAHVHDVQLLICGDGPAWSDVAARAAETNRIMGHEVVILTGELHDPRAAYDVADVCLGMGGSALRAMAFGKPLVVQGEVGFWELLTPETANRFLWQGWYGVGSNPGAGAAHLTGILKELLPKDCRQEELGRFGLSLVRERFSLQQAADTLLELYAQALSSPATTASTRTLDWRAAARFGLYESRRTVARWTGRETPDDFNAKPVAANQSPSAWIAG